MNKLCHQKTKICCWKIQGLGNECIDMVAADFRYHVSCMDNNQNQQPLVLSPTSIAYNDAFQGRQRRDAASAAQEYQISATTKIPQWMSFMDNNNKAHLLNFLYEAWCANSELLHNGLSSTLGGTFDDASKTVCISSSGALIMKKPILDYLLTSHIQ